MWRRVSGATHEVNLCRKGTLKRSRQHLNFLGRDFGNAPSPARTERGHTSTLGW